MKISRVLTTDEVAALNADLEQNLKFQKIPEDMLPDTLEQEEEELDFDDI